MDNAEAKRTRDRVLCLEMLLTVIVGTIMTDEQKARAHRLSLSVMRGATEGLEAGGLEDEFTRLAAQLFV